MSNRPIIEARNLSMRYPGGHVVFDHFSFRAYQDEIVAIVGRSGYGKSTLIHLLAGFLPPTGGEVTFKGEVIHGPSKDRGVMLQDALLYQWLSTRENIAFGLRFLRWTNSQVKTAVDSLLVELDLLSAEHLYPSELSGGMRQRVALGRSLAPKPELLLLDEPFSSLDAITRRNMRLLLERIVRTHELTLILVTHDIEEALLLADRVQVLSGSPAAVCWEADIRPYRAAHADFEFHPAFQRLKREILSAVGE